MMMISLRGAFPSRWLALLVIAATGAAGADEVIFLNGDRLTGRIVSVADGKLVLETEAAGEVTIDLKKVKTFSSDEPVKIRVGDQPPIDSKVAAGPAGQVSLPGTTEPLAIPDITAINPPAPAWHGEIALAGMLARGNIRREEIGMTFEVGKQWERDRFTFGGEYFYGRERDDETGDRFTADDYGEGFVRYERDLIDRLYGEVRGHVWHNSLAELDLRYAVGPGVGYRWFDEPNLTFFTDVGVAYIDERFDNFPDRDYWGLFLAYGLEWTPVKPVRLFSELEYLPSFSEFTENYLLDVIGGIHTSVGRGLFVELRVEYLYRSEVPGDNAKGELRLILGPGWEF